jgi:hypothetical protein
MPAPTETTPVPPTAQLVQKQRRDRGRSQWFGCLPPLARWLVLCGLATLAAPASAQTSQPDELDKLREALRQPGPEARLLRESAIDALFSRREPAAHAVLQEALLGGVGADEVAGTILTQLRRRFANPADPVFGAADKDRALRRSYVAALVSLFDEGRDATAMAGLREEVRQCLASGLQPLDRQTEFTAILGGADPSLKPAALAAAGECRDLGLAPLIAEHLDDAILGRHARRALTMLTFENQPFASRAAFDAWWAVHKDATYLQLAERAARGAAAALRKAEQKADERVIALSADLVAAWAAADAVPWKELGDVALSDEPPGKRLTCLERLRAVLAQRDRVAGAGPERLAFSGRLERLSEPGAPIAVQAVVLEVAAYVAALEEGQAAGAIADKLRAGLAHEDPRMKRAALAGMTRHASPENLAAAVAAGKRALAADDVGVVAAAVTTLGAASWPAPRASDPGRAEWLDFLVAVVEAEKVAEDAREAALLALGKRDADGKVLGEAFSPLLAMVADAKLAPLLRERAMVLLAGSAGSDPARASAFVDAMLSRLEDPERRVRLKAAQMLQSLPKVQDGAAERRLTVVQRAGERLLQEADEAVLRAVVACLEQQAAAEDPDPAPVVARLCAALEEMARSGKNGMRRAVLVSSLSAQASNQGLRPMDWIRAGQALLRVHERRELRNILARHRPLAQKDRLEPEMGAEAARLVVETALLRPDAEPWQDGGAEAGEVLEALRWLEGLKRPLDNAAVRILRLEALAALGRHAELIEAVNTTAGAAGVVLDEAQRRRMAILAAHAHIALSRPRLAVAALAELPPESMANPAVLGARADAAEALLRVGLAEDAVAQLLGVVKTTQEADPAYPRRFLRLVEAQLAAGHCDRAAAVQRLRDRRSLFSGENERMLTEALDRIGDARDG